MTGLNETLARLARLRREMAAFRPSSGGASDAAQWAAEPGHGLTGIDKFGPNPGNLRMSMQVPGSASAGAGRRPLVVALHGCAQSAAMYDAGSGWSTLARQRGFVLVCPEQRQDNNHNLCFNWFDPAHTQRDRGEAASIMAMVTHAIQHHGADPARVYVVGLSAGGAMANAMLASYPEVFAAGAIIAGLPFGAASNVSEALQMMAKGRQLPARVWGQYVRDATGHAGRWPRLSIWHGEADAIVNANNAEASLAQWVNVHAIAPEPHTIEPIGGHRRRVWRGDDGEAVVEAWSIAGMSHAVPLGAFDGELLGLGGPFHAEVGLSSTARIAAFWGIAPALPSPRATPVSAPGGDDPVAGVIEAAMRAAGLAGGGAAAGGARGDVRTSAHKAGMEAAAILRRMGLLKD